MLHFHQLQLCVELPVDCELLPLFIFLFCFLKQHVCKSAVKVEDRESEGKKKKTGRNRVEMVEKHTPFNYQSDPLVCV